MSPKKKIVVKDIDFKNTSKICKDFDGATGLYDHDKKIIYLHKDLPKSTKWPRRMILVHEQTHAKLMEVGASFPTWHTEAICDLMAIVQTPEKFMSHAEMTTRRAILDGGKYNWKTPSDREAIATRILESVQISPNRWCVNMLVGIFPMKEPPKNKTKKRKDFS